jgi:hypothetical protein
MQGGKLVCYGCMSGKPTTWAWQTFVFKGLHVSGFNIRWRGQRCLHHGRHPWLALAACVASRLPAGWMLARGRLFSPP